MAGLPEVTGLLYRADWTRLALSAELRSETDREPLPRPSREGRSRWYCAWPEQRQDNGHYAARGALLIGPGGRWRLESSVPGRGAEGEAAEGNDGEHGWSWRPPEMGGLPPLPVKVNGAEFRVHIPPGTRTVEETGNLIADAAAVMPGMKGTAARAAAEAVNRTVGAVSAARSFLDDLRGHR